jgi:broad specificity phosphatase PhoE
MSKTNKTTFIFCRHGESELNAANNREETQEANSPLTPLGKQQSEILAKSLFDLVSKNQQTLNILISNLDRTIDTSEPFLELLRENNIPFTHEFRNDIVEYLGPHKILDQQLLERRITLDKNWKEFIDKRVFKFFRELTTYPANSMNIIFSHGYFISALLAIIAVQGEYHGDQRVAFDLENCSKTIVTLNHTNYWFIIHLGKNQ